MIHSYLKKKMLWVFSPSYILEVNLSEINFIL